MPRGGWPVDEQEGIYVLPYFDTQKAEQIKQVINSEPVFHKTEDRSTRDSILQSELRMADPDAAIRGANKNPVGVYTQKNTINMLYDAPTFAILNWKQKPHIVGSANKYVIITESIPPSDLLTPKYFNAQDADDGSSRLYFTGYTKNQLWNMMQYHNPRQLEQLEDAPEYFETDYSQWPFWDFAEFVKNIQDHEVKMWVWSFIPELIRLERHAGYYPQQWKPSKIAERLKALRARKEGTE